MAAACLSFLREKMWDKEHGGYYFMVTREGKVVDSTKQLNPMSYTMEGLAEYALAFHDEQAAREALDLFRVIDRHAHDDKYGGYRIAFTADWQFIENYKDGPNGAGSFGRKSYDWHLGLLEALATLYESRAINRCEHGWKNYWICSRIRSSMPISAMAGITSMMIGAWRIARAIPKNPSMVWIWRPVG